MSRPRSSDPERYRADVGGRRCAAPDYLLLVGGPDRFPFDVQAFLDISKMTGRLDFDGDGDSYWSQCSMAYRRLSALKGTESGRAECAILRFRVDSATATARQDLIGRLLQYVKSEAFPTTDGRTLLTPIELLDKQATSAALRECATSQTSCVGFHCVARTGISAVGFAVGALTDTRVCG